MEELVLGIDIGGTNTKIGVVNRNGDVLLQSYLLTGQYQDAPSFLAALKKNLVDLLSEVKLDFDLKGIGVGAPVANYHTGIIRSPANISWKGDVDLKDYLQENFNISAVVANDANVAAVGEKFFGNAGSFSNFLMVTLGTGLGCGIYIDNKIYHGLDGMAGELGHVIVKQNGRNCACGRKGCLETYASATGITRTVYKLLADHTGDKSVLREMGFKELNAQIIDRAARNGDFIARRAFHYTGNILGKALADAMVMLNPEAIFLGGGLAAAGSEIFEPTEQALRENILGHLKETVKLLPSGLSANKVAILGAAALAWKNADQSITKQDISLN